MTTPEEALKRFGLHPPPHDLPLIRDLLETHTLREKSGEPQDPDLLRILCLCLFTHGLPQDILPLWRAKNASFDTFAGIDIQFLCGAGLPRTKAHLASLPGDAEAQAALAHLEKCEAAGDFAHFSPRAHLQHWERYFGVHSPAPLNPYAPPAVLETPPRTPMPLQIIQHHTSPWLFTALPITGCVLAAYMFIDPESPGLSIRIFLAAIIVALASYGISRGPQTRQRHLRQTAAVRSFGGLPVHCAGYVRATSSTGTTMDGCLYLTAKLLVLTLQPESDPVAIIPLQDIQEMHPTFRSIQIITTSPATPGTTTEIFIHAPRAMLWERHIAWHLASLPIHPHPLFP